MKATATASGTCTWRNAKDDYIFYNNILTEQASFHSLHAVIKLGCESLNLEDYICCDTCTALVDKVQNFLDHLNSIEPASTSASASASPWMLKWMADYPFPDVLYTTMQLQWFHLNYIQYKNSPHKGLVSRLCFPCPLAQKLVAVRALHSRAQASSSSVLGKGKETACISSVLTTNG